tara:strand:+ start:258 stop:767 length:510 start_codon:yes stop_codon:yes gene_type:complete
MSINKFNPNNFSRKYESLSINTKTLTTKKFENFSNVLPVLSDVNVSGDFSLNSFEYKTTGTYYNNFCKLEIKFNGLKIINNTRTGILEFRVYNNVPLVSISPTAATDFIFGTGSFVISFGDYTYSIISSETFFDGTYWKIRCTFESANVPTTTSSPENSGNITLFYNRV